MPSARPSLGPASPGEGRCLGTTSPAEVSSGSPLQQPPMPLTSPPPPPTRLPHCSPTVGPRRPFAKDEALDYEVMSDLDWEEEPEGEVFLWLNFDVIKMWLGRPGLGGGAGG